MDERLRLSRIKNWRTRGKHLILIADLKEWATRFKSFLSLVLMSYFFLNLSFWWYIGRVLFHVGSLNGTIKKAMSQM